MPFVHADPHQYLLTGSQGRLVNRGSAVRTYLLPGSIWVLVPSTKQEADFEFTQETRDGIPLRFKGIVVYRVTDPIAAARQFDFSTRFGIERISDLLTHVGLGELRHAVSHMTMVECIEQRKTTLSEVVAGALARTIEGEGSQWGITIEVAQLAQVYIVDTELRQQLEAEVRNDIRRKSDESDIATREATRLTEMASDGRVDELRVAGERDRLRREEELRAAEIERDRRMAAAAVASQQQAIELELERFRTEVAADQAKSEAEAPVRRLRIQNELDIQQRELELRDLRRRVRSLEVDEELTLRRAEQQLREAILPLEQAPAIVDAASRVLQGTNLSIYGEGGALVGQLAPVLEVIASAVQRATANPVAVPTDGAASAG